MILKSANNSIVKKLSSLKLVCISFLLLSGCIGDHYGYSNDEWNNLSAEQQKKAKEKYSELVAEKNNDVHGDKIEKATEDFKKRARHRRKYN